MVKTLFEAAAESLDKREVIALFREAVQAKRGGRGPAKKKKLSQYDRELRQVYSRCGARRGKNGSICRDSVR